MKKSKIQLYLFFGFGIIYSFNLTAQVSQANSRANNPPMENLLTLFENIDPVENDVFVENDTFEIIFAKDQAWGGVETSDGGLLVVGNIEYKAIINGDTTSETKGFIRRYHFPDLSNDPYDSTSYDTYTQHTKLFTEWREINDIIAIGNNQYIIVGLLDGPTAVGQLGKIGIAVITDNTNLSEDHRLVVLHKMYLGNSQQAIASSANGVIRHGESTRYTAVLFNPSANHSTFLLSFNFEAGEFIFNRISEPYVGLRLPQNLALCGDYLVVAGQGINALGEPLVITSWSKDNLSLISSYVGPAKHKPKMVACAGPQGVIACGGFDYGQGTLVKSLAYFPDPSNFNDLLNPPTKKYFNAEIQQIVDLDPTWITNESYCEAVADRSTGGWIFAGQTGLNNAEDMAAIIVENANDTLFTVTGYTDVLGGASSSADVDLANYVIQLSNESGQPNRYALFGIADKSGDVSNTYVVIVSEPEQ